MNQTKFYQRNHPKTAQAQALTALEISYAIFGWALVALALPLAISFVMIWSN